jgi:hypothetical protein
MATFLFSYRMPADYQPGRPGAIANWEAFFQGLGDRVVDRGKPASETAEVGHCGVGTRPGGYSPAFWRTGRNTSRSVWASSAGSATAGKWPPRSCSAQ